MANKTKSYLPEVLEELKEHWCCDLSNFISSKRILTIVPKDVARTIESLITLWKVSMIWWTVYVQPEIEHTT